MVAQMTTMFGIRVETRWSEGEVLLKVGEEEETTAFALVDQSGLDLKELPSGDWRLAYQKAGGELGRQVSRDEGATWQEEL